MNTFVFEHGPMGRAIGTALADLGALTPALLADRGLLDGGGRLRARLVGATGATMGPEPVS